jgi:hypothetical protein
VENNSVTIRSVTSPVDGWLVIHSGDAQNAGPVLGQTRVTAGLNTDVTVELAVEGRTDILWPMLHEDTGEVGVYEFGTVEGADAPVFVGDAVATLPIWTVPHMRTLDQIVMHGDGMEMGDMAPTVTVQSALCEAQCFVVIHQEADGSFGGVSGVSESLPAGLNRNITITLDPDTVTPRLWPMLHVDDGAVGTYEFGTVEGADAPVQAMGEVVTFPINAAPALVMQDQALMDGRLEITNAIMDAPGWVAIHSDNNGEPGPVLATALLHPGANWHVMIEVDPAAAGSRVFPMLHYDTGEAGVYEFGTVEGADAPTFVGGNVIFAPLGITQ